MFLRILTASMATAVIAAGAASAQTTGTVTVGPPASGSNITIDPGPSQPGGSDWNYNYGRWQNRGYYQGQYYNPQYNGPTWGIDPYYYRR